MSRSFSMGYGGEVKGGGEFCLERGRFWAAKNSYEVAKGSNEVQEVLRMIMECNGGISSVLYINLSSTPSPQPPLAHHSYPGNTRNSAVTAAVNIAQ